MISNRINDLIKVLNIVNRDKNLLNEINKSISLLNETISNNLPLLVFGNGGSAADALHITGELVGKFLIDRKAININCLNGNVSVLTAWANDFSFDTVFERQIEAYGTKGGVCWGLSTSGNSLNVINGFIKAKKLGMSTLAFTGKDGGELKKFSDLIICVPSSSTPRIQEVHLIVYHYICEQLEILQLNKG